MSGKSAPVSFTCYIHCDNWDMAPMCVVCQKGSVPDPAAVLHTLYRKQEQRKRVLGWRCTRKDPFEGEWEQVLSWLLANPER